MRKFLKPNTTGNSLRFQRTVRLFGRSYTLKVWHWLSRWNLKPYYQPVGSTLILGVPLSRFLEVNLTITKEYNHA